MNREKPISPSIGFFILAFLWGTAPDSWADELYLWADEVDGDVIWHHQGSIDLTDFPTAYLSTPAFTGIIPNEGTYLAIAGRLDVYSGVVPPASGHTFGAMGGTTNSSLSGDSFAFEDGALALPENYPGRQPLRGSMTFESSTLVSLGVDTTPLSFNTTVGTNTIHLFRKPATPPTVDNSALRTALEKKIKKLSKKVKSAKKRGQSSKGKKLNRKVKTLKARLKGLG